MSDIVERLRSVGRDYDFHENAYIYEAANEIERLREALELADGALALVTAFEDDARYIMGNTNFTICRLRREQVRAALPKGGEREV